MASSNSNPHNQAAEEYHQNDHQLTVAAPLLAPRSSSEGAPPPVSPPRIVRSISQICSPPEQCDSSNTGPSVDGQQLLGATYCSVKDDDDKYPGDMTSFSAPNFSVRYFARNDSESSETAATPSAVAAPSSTEYWTINDRDTDGNDTDSIDIACEADEESIASSLKAIPMTRPTEHIPVEASAPTFTASTSSTGSSRQRYSSDGVSQSGVSDSLQQIQTTISTKVTTDEPNVTYKVVTKREKITFEAPLPSLDEAKQKPPVLAIGSIHDLTLEKVSQLLTEILERYQRLPLVHYRLISVGVLVALYYVLPGFLSGICFGLYFALIAFLFFCVSEPNAAPAALAPQVCDKIVYEVKHFDNVESSTPRIYKGWMNILNEPYNPRSFHVNNLQTVLVRLDGNTLRISRPERALLKHAFHDDPTLTKREPTMLSQSIFDLTNASVKLRPKRLAKRRWFSRKYPIYIKLASPDAEIHSRNEDKFLMTQSKTFQSLASESESNSGSGNALTKLFRRKRNRKPSVTSHSSSNSNSVAATDDITPSESMPSPNLAERMTVGDVEVCREADGYISDVEDRHSDSSDADVVGVHRSYSAENLNRAPILRLQKNFPGAKSKAFKKIYLFARSAREKERWFHMLRKASMKYTESPKNPTAGSRKLSLPSISMSSASMTKDYFLYLLHHLQYSKHLDETLRDNEFVRKSQTKDTFGTVFMDLGRNKWTKPEQTSSNEFVVIVNLLASRIFYDFCRDEYWCNAVRNKIQTKLATIHLPYFIETLELSKFDIGTAIPQINKIYSPTVDEWGTWVDLDIKYEGCIRLVLETKVNLMKLKGANPDPIDTNPNAGNLNTTQLLYTTQPASRYSDEEIPESPETSPDEDFGSKMKLQPTSTRKKTGKKLLTVIDRIAHSNFFKEAAELKPVKAVMQEISSTPLILNVEVTALEGTLALNLAAPPSDRLWYGFRKPPNMSVKAIPQVGDRSVMFSTVSDWIESKLQMVLEKNLVCPNMDDVVVPVLSGNELLSDLNL
uniref:SMP-LTD domain-containing protein n=1 Tax=Panagrellus redivivus TaxID=6233 RepID=A0A7E4VV27_PANRE